MKNSHSASYAAAGVDVTAGYEAVERIKPMVESTYIPGVMGTLGGFGGMFAPDMAGMKKPVLVSGTDGVGTKLRVAQLLNKHDTIGIDCVAMCVNDIICGGAAPLFFLDYIACGKNDPVRIAEIVSGITEGCRQSECALVGGETAEHPGLMPDEDYDVAGFSVGIVDEEKIIDGKKLSQGDVLIGLGSTGVHSNGFSLVRKVLDVENADLTSPMEELGGKSLGETLLTPTRIYVKAIKALLKAGVDIHAISHITGGGFYENVPRMMTEGLTAQIKLDTFPRLPIFDLIQKKGEIPERDMYNTFNMGIGMILALPAQQAAQALEILKAAGEQAYQIGQVVSGEAGHRLQPRGLRSGAGPEGGYPHLCGGPEGLFLQPGYDPGPGGAPSVSGHRPGCLGGLHGHPHQRDGPGLPQRHPQRPPRPHPLLCRTGLLWPARPREGPGVRREALRRHRPLRQRGVRRRSHRLSEGGGGAA